MYHTGKMKTRSGTTRERRQETVKKRSPPELGPQRGSQEDKIRRLERVVLVLCLIVLFLAVLGIGLAGTVSRLVMTFQFITEQVQFIIEQIDAIREGIPK